ncbi:MAG: S8 family serine peptidase [Halorubrum sp.]
MAVGTALLPKSVTASEGDSDRYIVGTNSNAARRAAHQRSEAVHRELDFGALGSAVAGRFPEPAREALEKRDDVRYVEPDETVDIVGQTVDDGVERIGAPAVHDSGEDGAGTHVAIIDTGIDSDHETLASNLGEGYAPAPCSDGCDEEWDDTHGHGTGVAGVVGAADNDVGTLGVAHSCTLHAVRVMDGDSGASVSDIAAGLEWTADRGHDVANMSLGADITSSTLEDACQYAHDNGVLLVSSAGNAGEADSVTVPAAYDTVVAVSAVDDDDALASFSSTGPEVELTAPGVSITVPDVGDEYTYRSGTSFSGPHVAGVGALLMADGTTRSDARSRLAETAEDIGLSADEQGNGLVDAAAAVDRDEEGLTVTTNGAGEVDESTATLGGELTELVGYDSATVSFEWGTSGDELSNTTAEQTLDSTGQFSDQVTGLEENTEYEFRAIAEADTDTATGSTASFTTAGVETPPSVSTVDASDVDTTEGVLNGALDDLGSADSVDVRFDYRRTGASDWSATSGQTLDATGDFSGQVTDLDSDAEYEFRAVAESSAGTDAGDTATFTTEAVSDSEPPEIVEFTVTDAGNPAWDRFDVDWAVSDDGSLASVELELIDSGGSTVDSVTNAVDGDSASDSDRLEYKGRGNNTYTVAIAVSDAAGNVTDDSQDV